MERGAATASDFTAAGFDLDAIEPGEGTISVTGRWHGVRGRRFMRPSLSVAGEAERVLAELEHKPWSAADGEPWLAVFRWERPLAEVEALELTVAPDLTVRLEVRDAARPRPRRRSGAEARLREALRERDAARAERDRLAGERDGARQERDEAREQAERLRQELRLAEVRGEAEAEALRTQLALAREELIAAREELTAARKDLAAAEKELLAARSQPRPLPVQPAPPAPLAAARPLHPRVRRPLELEASAQSRWVAVAAVVLVAVVLLLILLVR